MCWNNCLSPSVPSATALPTLSYSLMDLTVPSTLASSVWQGMTDMLTSS